MATKPELKQHIYSHQLVCHHIGERHRPLRGPTNLANPFLGLLLSNQQQLVRGPMLPLFRDYDSDS